MGIIRGIIRAGGSCMKRMTIKTVNNYNNTKHFDKNSLKNVINV